MTYRLGADGPYKIANEVAIGLTMPRPRSRCAGTAEARGVHGRVLPEIFAPGDAAVAGFLDRVVPAEVLARRPEPGGRAGHARPGRHTATKLRARAQRCRPLAALLAATAGSPP